MIIQGSPEILRGPRGLNNQFGAFNAADDAVKQLYRDVVGREADPGGLQYFVDRFGDSIDSSEAAIFQSMAQPEIQARDAYLTQQAAAQAAAQAAIDAANRQAVADALAAAQAAARAAVAAAADNNLREEERFRFLRKKAVDAVRALYLQVLGREGDEAGLNYFADRFGDVIDPDELQIFKGMAQPEIDARNAYLADMAKKSKEDAAKAKAIADQFAAAQAAAAAAAKAAAAAEAATKKAIADAFAAAQAAAKAAADAKTLAAKQAAEALRARALVVVKALYLQVLGREGDQAGLDYFADRFGDVIDPDELQIFSDMSKPEIDARNAYLKDMAAKSKEDAAKAKAIADQFAATAAKAKADAAAAVKTVVNTTSAGISPALILAAAAAFFFAG